ncbi:hypothetical protein BDY21DRAFT_351261 [Lineolata rhizophorae]|uniref:Protein kinase domain-containing protein n=1 Tax=Lineolata rhizophorae TaxID=578093 RepID=A0A6A6NTP7_9PEZI|nr:hypothetical protein BDY21DRAFT_351261 [Lineolata rhizophorae]
MPAGRSMGRCTQNDGETVNILLEWRASVPATLSAYLTKVADNIPTDEDVNRPEEIRTMKIAGIFHDPQRTAIVYLCPRQPVNLRDVLRKIEKPSGSDRRALASIIATKVRSLHVHFHLQHMALRAESFVFLGENGRPDFANPYILDWGRPSFASIYQHPEYQKAEPHWFYDVWSLMMVLSEIAEWQPVEACGDESELLKKKLERTQKVTDPGWKGDLTARVFQHGFGFLGKIPWEGQSHPLAAQQA